MSSGAGGDGGGFTRFRFGWDDTAGTPPLGARVQMPAGGVRAAPDAEVLVGEVFTSNPQTIITRWDNGRRGTIDADHFNVMVPSTLPEPEVSYCGARTSEGPMVLRVVEGVEPVELEHVVRHAPSGYDWGYAGSGAADLARSLLVDALPATAVRCPACGGIGTGCTARCEDGYLPLPYQDFKFGLILALEDTWTLTRQQIRDWMIERAGATS